MSLKNLIKNNHEKQNRFSWKGVEVIVKDKINNPDINLKTVFDTIGEKIPQKFLKNVDIIYIGEFDMFKEREIQAMYENSCIFVTNDQDNIGDMCDDIVHEIAHSLEEIHRDIIYSDGFLEKEFLMKRQQVHSLLTAEGYNLDLFAFMNPDYSEDFDNTLYKEVGYPLLNALASSIFYSPYAITSLREYFANGFEALFYYGDYEFVNKSCPVLFERLTSIMEVEY
tara:strand:+ start:633 stop:1307 length:675 start_codon:yes stop_codon:yes gene_type:complete